MASAAFNYFYSHLPDELIAKFGAERGPGSLPTLVGEPRAPTAQCFGLSPTTSASSRPSPEAARSPQRSTCWPGVCLRPSHQVLPGQRAGPHRGGIQCAGGCPLESFLPERKTVGAQFLPEEKIFGRWDSDVILRYIREAPLCQLSALAIEAGHNDSLSRDARNGRTCGTSPATKERGPA